MVRRKVYTEEELADKASRYTVLYDFRKKERKAYDAIRGRGLLDKLCGHMERKNTPVGVLTKEHCHQVAQNYYTRKEFVKGSPKEYWAAQRHGWLDDICSHMKPIGNKYWRRIYVFTFQDGYAYVGLAQDPDRRYRDHTKTDDRSPVYQHIKDTGIMPDFELLTDWLHKDRAAIEEEEYRMKYAAEGWIMLNRRKCGSLGKPNETFYTHERLLAEISKYEYHDEFKKNSPRYYNYLVNHHLIEEYCSCLKRRNTRHRYWTLERSIEIAKKCDTRTELLEEYPGAYKVLSEKGLVKKILPMSKGLPKDIHMSRIAECNSRSDLYYKYQSTYNWALRNGLLDSLFESKVHERTYEENLEIIKSCKTRRELREKYGRVYKWGMKKNLLDEYLPLEKQGLSDEEKLVIIFNCSSRGELHDNHRSIYQWAKKKHLLDEYLPKGR